MSTPLTPVAESVLSSTFARAMTRAGEALGTMSGHQIRVTAPSIRRCSAAEVIEMAGGAESVVVGVYVGITGSLSGHAVLLLPPDGARRLAQILLEGFIDPPPAGAPDAEALAFDEMEFSALQEVGNVTISAFLNELGMHLREAVQPTVPQALVEMSGAILEAVLMDLIAESDEVLAAQTTFMEGENAVDAAMLVLPRQESLGVLLESLGAAPR
jgi:chemotaxis protein CheC